MEEFGESKGNVKIIIMLYSQNIKDTIIGKF